MFAVLRIKESEKGFRAKLREKMTPYEPAVYKVNVKNGTPFLAVEVKLYKGKVVWEEVERALGRYSRSMLLPNYIVPPEDSSVKQIDLTNILPARMMLNTAAEVSSHSDIPPSNKKIAVIDENGIYMDMIELLFNHAGIIKIITGRTDEYERLAGLLLKEWGVGMIISSDIESAGDSNIIITPSGLIPSKTNAVIFTCEKSTEKVSRTLYCPPVKLPEDYLYLLPRGVDEDRFTRALYEFCAVKSLDKNRFDMMVADGFDIGLYSMARMIY